MNRVRSSAPVARRPIAATLLVLSAAGLIGSARQLVAQSPGAPAAAEAAPELPHPFFTHMGLPEGVGNFNLRLMGIATQGGDAVDGDFAFHLETGLTQRIGLHIRNDGVRNNLRTEAMFQFAAIVSEDGMSGFAPIVEFEFPTHSGAGSRINTLVGFSSTLVGRRAVFNQVLHYNPREDMVEGSAALVFQLGRMVFPVVEVFGEGGRGEPTMVSLLGGVKLRLREWLNVGLAVRLPVTSAKNFSSQGALGPDVEWKW